MPTYLQQLCMAGVTKSTYNLSIGSKINKIKTYRAKQKRAVFCSLFRLKAMKERAHRLYIPASNIVGKVQRVAGFPTMRDVGLLEPTRNRAGEVNNKSGWGN